MQAISSKKRTHFGRIAKMDYRHLRQFSFASSRSFQVPRFRPYVEVGRTESRPVKPKKYFSVL
jgi:hypothetical protein